MRNLPALVSLYTKVDGFLEEERSVAATRAETERCDEQKRLNDQAYFLICWGQIEAEIDDACRAAIRAKRAHAEWEVRRGWDLYNPDDKRLSGLRFEERVALVLDRAGGTDSPCARVLRYYALRNLIAHGRLHPDGIDIAAVCADFYAIQSALTR